MVQTRKGKPVQTVKTKGKLNRNISSGTLSSIRKSPYLSIADVTSQTKLHERILEQLKPSDISEFRVMNRPSEGALMTMKAVLILLGNSEANANWDNAQRMMVNPKPFIGTLCDLKPASVPNKIIKKVTEITKTKNIASI